MVIQFIWRRPLAALLLFSLALFAPGLAFPQSQLTLQEAVRTALSRNPAQRIARAEYSAAAAGVTLARTPLLPQITFSEQAVRSNDQVTVFGTKLRQQRFTAADFDLAQLNTPSAIGNFNTRIAGQWNLFDSFATARSLDGARHARTAAERALDRAEQELTVRVIEAYYAVLAAQRQVAVSGATVQTARAIHERSSARVESGVAIESDRLSTLVNLSAREADLARARNDLSLAQYTLASILGDPAAATNLPVEPETAAGTLPALDSLEAEAISRRPDLLALAAGRMAQQSREAAARAAFGPRLNAFGAWESNTRRFFGSEGDSWTAGLELKFDILPFAQRGRLAQERARVERAAAVLQAAEDEARIEVRSAYYAYESAKSQAELMQQAMQHASESLRILRDRYESGLTTIADLLRGEEAARQAESDRWTALYQMRTAMGALRLATGTLSPDSLEY